MKKLLELKVLLPELLNLALEELLVTLRRVGVELSLLRSDTAEKYCGASFLCYFDNIIDFEFLINLPENMLVAFNLEAISSTVTTSILCLETKCC